MILEEMKRQGEAPEWMSEPGLKTLQGGYLLPDETPLGMYRRVAMAAASYYPKSAIWEERFFQAMWKNWLCPASPVLSNMGTDRGLPISCLTGDTWISTPNGGKQIKDIEIGDRVLTHTGSFQKVTAKKSRMSNSDLYQLKINTRQTKTKITGNHPVLTNHGWVRVDQLDSSKHLVATSYRIDLPEIEHVLDLKDFCHYPTVERGGKLYKEIENNGPNRKKKKNGVVDYYSSPNRLISVDEEVGWFIGLWLAEGSLSRNNKKDPNGIRITLGTHEVDLAERFLEIAKNRFGLSGNIYHSECTRENFANGKKTSWISVHVNGGSIGNFFLAEFGKDCKTKTLPEWFVNLPKSVLRSALDALLLGDGHRRPNGTHQLVLSNPILLMGVYNIYLKLGKRVSLQMQAKPSSIGTTKYVYCINELSEGGIRLSSFSSSQGVFFNDLYFCNIQELEHLKAEEEVFDITVENDHSFTAHGFVVHNCNSIHSGDSVDSIFDKAHELAMLSKNGAGVGIYLGDIRGRGAPIRGNGKSEGIIPWSKVFDSVVISVSQGSTRRGAAAVYLPIEHVDIEEFINIRKPTGDANRRCLNLNHGVCVTDEWMKAMLGGDTTKRRLWQEILTNRVTTGEPYLFFTDNVNKANPTCYTERGLDVKTSNICTEIFLHTDPDHSFVCCLSSMNLVKWDEWRNTDAVEVAVRFLDAVIQEYIEKSENIPGLEASRRSALKGRAVGLGVLGWHTLLQSKMIPFDSFDAMMLNAEIFRSMKTRAENTTAELANELGEPEWCKGFNRRNTHLLAIAPTVSNSTISGGHSAGVEPIAANIFSQKSAKGTFIKKNSTLELLLQKKGKDTPEVWKLINEQSGSVQQLKFLTDKEKEVFLTAREINQYAIVKQAAQRQKFIDQGQSINLFFGANADPKYIHGVHVEAWESGLKSLYYLRTEGVIRGDLASRTKDECAACEG